MIKIKIYRFLFDTKRKKDHRNTYYFLKYKILPFINEEYLRGNISNTQRMKQILNIYRVSMSIHIELGEIFKNEF